MLEQKIKSIIKIIKNWKNPIFLRNLILYKLSSIIKRNKGFYILNQSWDNLIILDACRFDIFKKYIQTHNITGNLEKKISRGSHTKTFLKENFKDISRQDIVYITANPYVDKMITKNVYKIISVWKDGWSEENHTVMPETMYRYTIDALTTYPNKKFIIHFMQPHFPFIGFHIGTLKNEDLRNRVLNNTNKKIKRKHKDNFLSYYDIDVYKFLKKEIILKLYKRNLKLSMPYVEKLSSILPGKTVITSDHGEAIGEFLHPLVPIRLYGHNENFRTSVLVEVPWFEIETPKQNCEVEKSLIEKAKIIKSIKNISSSFEA